MERILNLVYPEKSDIEYDIVKFSDSQIQWLKDAVERLQDANRTYRS